MRALSNSDILDLWERGGGLHPLDRALLTLASAEPDKPYGALADWPLGRRNAVLARLRRACFGAVFTGWVACPECGERLEFSFDAGTLLEEADQTAAPLTLNGRGFRPLTSRDLASVAGEIDEQAAARKLLRLCCSEAGDFTEQELETLSEQLAGIDPLAETLLDFACAGCGHHWQEPLDIASWLWAEIEASARRLLHDVHTLARAYGWTERDILSLSASRRACYLEMVRA